MLANIGLYSYGTAVVAYSLLAGFALLMRNRNPMGLPFLAASGLTALWAGSVVLSSMLPYPQVKLMQLTEVARNAAWCFLLLRHLGLKLQGSDHWLASRRWILWYIAGFISVIGVLFIAPALSRTLSLSEEFYLDLAFAIWLAMAILGLLLLEQIYRNSTGAERWSIKFLCLGLGFLFAYDFFMYAEALLFRQLDRSLWQARGLVVALAAFLLAIAAGRASRDEEPRNLSLSRHVVFHSVTLLAAGIYLFLMALVGYYLRFLGGDWGGVLQIAFLCASGLLLLALLFSGQIRARTRVWLSKNFFSYKYDYRDEWQKFTRTLATGSANVPESIVQAMAELFSSPAGLLWARTEQGSYSLACNWGLADTPGGKDLQALADWLEGTDWIVDLREWRQTPDLYDNLQLPALITDIPRAWLVVPLFFGERLQGILLLRESELKKEINWEDRDLLKLAGRQAASHLAQYQADKALVESRQFEAFNRLSAYVTHDLKNILAQQSLIVSNAEKHRDNPAFVDDMLNTVRNSVGRMTNLMEQMRSGARSEGMQRIALCPLLKEAVSNRQHEHPVPTMKQCAEDLLVDAEREHLTTVFTHIIQNAQEATTRQGRVNVRLMREGKSAIVEIEDNGIGMDADFLRNRLFKPFDSTKGLTGMGIGAFESREFIRDLGGDIRVTSTPGAGSLFQIVLPCTLANEEINEANPTVKEGINT